MPSNLEIKVLVRDFEAVHRAAEAVTGGPPCRIRQHDTFYGCWQGRLKLRRFPVAGGGEAPGELIAYDRPDVAGTRRSDYQLVAVAEPQRLHETLSRALGVLAEVRKERLLWLVGRTRVHLDRVDGLGTFLELEVVLQEGEAAADAEPIAANLLADLGLTGAEVVAGAYVDLLR